MSINEELEQLYKKGKEQLGQVPISNEEPTNPLMLYVNEEYLSKPSVILFGQETNDWHGKYDLTKEPLKEMEKYNNFWYDKKSSYSNTGVLMQTFNDIQKECKDIYFIWNNIIKIGKTGIGTPKKLLDWQKDWFGIVKQEIELVSPQMMIFFTGRNYDKFIAQTFGKFEIIMIDDLDTHKICQIKFLDYPQITAYRTYHPSYLRRSGLGRSYLPLLKNKIKTLQKDFKRE